LGKKEILIVMMMACYDAYAAIWASDALQYSGGSVTHSSAYKYKANKDAAIIAKLIGEDPAPFEKEATENIQRHK
jgi:hypothetical protein